MPNGKLTPASVELLNERMDQLSREISALERDDPRRTALVAKKQRNSKELEVNNN